MVMGKMVWMAMRGGRGVLVLQPSLSTKAVGLGVAGEMVMDLTSLIVKGKRSIPK